jgi:hypothetical protein
MFKGTAVAFIRKSVRYLNVNQSDRRSVHFSENMCCRLSDLTRRVNQTLEVFAEFLGRLRAGKTRIEFN